MELIEIIGWVGNACFMLSALPQAIMCYKQGHARGVSVGLLSLWFIGESLAMIYGFAKDLPAPLLVNYACNFVFLCVIIFYKVFERRGINE